MKIFSELSLCLGLILAIAPWAHAQDIPWDDVGKTGSDLADLATRDASDLTNTPAGNIAATDAQAAINELDTEKATTAQGALADSATQPGDNVSTLTNDSGYLTTTLANPQFAARATRRAIVSDATGTLATIANGVTPGTGSITIGAWVALDDWTPSETKYLIYQVTGGNGFYLSITESSGVPRLGVGNGAGSNNSYNATAAPTILDGQWGFLAAVINRAGNVTFFFNGDQLGASVDISGLSAVTADSASPLYIGSTSTDKYWAGDFSETFISSDLATAAQIAAIHANGTARGSGLTMLAHWEPSLSQGVLFEDISGNNLHAIIGTTGISRNYELVESFAPASQALVSDGTAGSKLYSTLNGQDPGTGDCMIGGEGLIRSTTSTGLIAGLSDSLVTIGANAYAFTIYYNSTGLRVRLNGASSTDYRLWVSSAALYEQLLDKRVLVYAYRTASEVRIYLGLNGNAYDVTSMFTYSESGFPPAYDVSINGDYLIVNSYSGSSSTAQDLHALELLNVAPTLAEFEYRIRNGGWEPKFAAGSNTNLVTNPGAETNLTGIATSNSGGTVYTFTRNTASPIEGVADALLDITGAGASSSYPRFNYSSGSIDDALAYGVVVKTKLVSGTFVINGIRAGSGGSTLQGPTTLSGSQTFTLRAEQGDFVGTDGIEIQIDGRNVGAAQIDSVSITPIGVTTSLDLSDAGGYQPKNPSAANGSSHWTMSTSGITWAKPATYGKTLSVTGSLTWADTHEAKSLLGQEALPSNAIIDAITFVATAGSTGDGITIGTTTDPDQFVTVNTYTTTAENFAGSQLTSPFPGGTATNDLTIVVDPDTANYTGSITTTVTYHLANY